MVVLWSVNSIGFCTGCRTKRASVAIITAWCRCRLTAASRRSASASFNVSTFRRGGLRASNPAIQRALRDVAAFMGRPMPAPAPKHRSLDRRTLLVGGAAAGVAAGGLAIWRLALSPQVALANTIAVLPFENLSGEPGKQYLSDGLAAELRARLARNPLLHVVGQVSSNSFRDRSENSRDVSRKLNVANLLDGNVRIADNAIRVAVELIDGASGFSKWSTSFDRPLSNLLALQDSDVANAVSAALSSRLGQGRPGADREAAERQSWAPSTLTFVARSCLIPRRTKQATAQRSTISVNRSSSIPNMRRRGRPAHVRSP